MTGFDTVADTGDGVHPNDSGFQKMANRWSTRRLTPRSAARRRPHPPAPFADPAPPVPDPTTTSRPPTTPPPTATGRLLGHVPESQRMGRRLPGRGPGGQRRYQRDDLVDGDPGFPNGQRITQIWNARTNSTGSPYMITNESYNNAIAPGGNVTFGFLGSWSGTNANPTASCARTP